MLHLLASPYRFAPWWATALVVLFGMTDLVRGAFNINLGRLPMWFKLLYIRVALLEFGFLGEAEAREIAINRWQRRAAFYGLGRELRNSYYGLLLKRRGIQPMAGGATIVGSRSGLFWKNVPGGLPVIQDAKAFTGNVFFVDANAAQTGTTSGFGTHPDKALSTIDAAINLCTASQGDTIFVLPGHTETVSAATTIVPDTAGISIIGLGVGGARPTLTYSLAAGNIPISGANTVLSNFLMLGTAAIDVTSGITVTGADVVLEDIEFRETGATVQFAICITLGTGGDRARIIRPIHRGHASGDANTSAISCSVALDGVYIEEPYLDGLYSNGGIYNVTVAMTNLTIVFPGGAGLIRNRHATQDGGINVVATTSGQILSPRIRTATNDADGFNLAIVAADMQVYDPLVVNLDGETGGAWGTASAAA